MRNYTPRVYLSGPITGCTYEGCTDWREYAIKKLAEHGIEGFSPMRGKEYLAGAGVILDGSSAVISNFMSQDKAIVTRDRMDTTQCDMMLCNLSGATMTSIGTMIELGWADLARRPVVTVVEPKGSLPGGASNIHEHAFMRELSGYRVDTLDAALHIIIAALAHKGSHNAVHSL